MSAARLPLCERVPVRREWDVTRGGWQRIWLRSEPVLIEGALDGTPALSRWSADYLAERAGSELVPLEFSVRPIYRPDPRINGGRYQRKVVSLNEALAAITRRSRGPYHYLSTLEVRTLLPMLAEDVPLPGLLEGKRRLRGIYLFAGGAGTGSQTHYDLTDNFIAVFRGRKRVLLFQPGQFSIFKPLSVVNPLCNMSRLDLGRVGRLHVGRCHQVRCFESEVGPGDLLFIPLHWWHFVRNEELSLGVTYSFDVAWRRRLSWRHLRVDLRSRAERWFLRPPSMAKCTFERAGVFLRRGSETKELLPVSGLPSSEIEKTVVPLEFVLRHARLTQQLAFAGSAARAFLVAREAERRAIEVDDESVQEAADIFRRERGLLTAQATEHWLASAGLSPDDFEELIRSEVVARRVREAITRDQVVLFFRDSIVQFETATVSRIRHHDEGVIQEIRVIEADGDQDFHALARQCSEDTSTAAAGGFVGAVALSSLPEPIREQIRTARPGDVLGPVQHGSTWELYKLEAYAPPVLDDATRERASRLLFDRWLDAQLNGVRVEGLGVVP
jgi:putative peptide maturation system protein